MKSRKVMLSLEVKTNFPIKILKEAAKKFYPEDFAQYSFEVVQVQANVIKKEK